MPELTPIGVGTGLCQQDEREHSSPHSEENTRADCGSVCSAVGPGGHTSANFRVFHVQPGRDLRTLLS